jgi:hypothetical protein
MKRSIFIVISTYLMLSVFTNCGSNKGGGIQGKWEITEAEGALADLNKGTVYYFVDDKKLVMSKSGVDNKTKYTINADTLTYFIGYSAYKTNYKIEGNKMYIQIINSDQKFVLTKK